MRENDVGKPVAISAFYRARGGAIDITTGGGTGAGLNGKATYKGPAIGQYAINDMLEGGAFTATATLNATFGIVTNTPDTGLTGMIKDFRLNGRSEDPGWEVTLQKGAWIADSHTDSAASQKGHIEDAMTAWSINGKAAAPAGSWVATMYDEAVVDKFQNNNYGSNHPTAILGKFYSEYGGTHRMTGAFGTRLLPPEE